MKLSQKNISYELQSKVDELVFEIESYVGAIGLMESSYLCFKLSVRAASPTGEAEVLINKKAASSTNTQQKFEFSVVNDSSNIIPQNTPLLNPFNLHISTNKESQYQNTAINHTLQRTLENDTINFSSLAVHARRCDKQTLEGQTCVGNLPSGNTSRQARLDCLAKCSQRWRRSLCGQTDKIILNLRCRKYWILLKSKKTAPAPLSKAGGLATPITTRSAIMSIADNECSYDYSVQIVCTPEEFKLLEHLASDCCNAQKTERFVDPSYCEGAGDYRLIAYFVDGSDAEIFQRIGTRLIGKRISCVFVSNRVITEAEVVEIPKQNLVYFIQAGNTSFFKIGCTKDVENRIQEISLGCPQQPIVKYYLPCENFSVARKTERWLHTRFSNKRVRNNAEWFILTSEDFDGLRQTLSIKEAQA